MPTKDAQTKTDPAPTIRESLAAALAEQRDPKPEGEEDEELDAKDTENEDEHDDPLSLGVLEDDKPKKTKAKGKEVEPEDEVKEPEEEIDDAEAQEEIEPEVKDTKKAPKETVAAPANWKNKEWERTPLSIRKDIVKREQEFTDGVKQYSDKAKAFDEYEQVLGPRRQHMAAIGVSPLQVIHRSLEWMDALGHPDPKVKSEAFKVLASNFKVDIRSLIGDGNTGEGFRIEGQGDADLPPAVKTYITGLENKLAQLEQNVGGLANNYETEKQRAASEYMTNWASDKPHFQNVASLMGSLLQSGTVPLKGGQLDLDTAYQMACKAHPQVAELMRLEDEAKAKKEADTKAKKARQAKQTALNKARSAGGSLRPGAPAAAALNGGKPGLSVRDTIKLSLKQIAE